MSRNRNANYRANIADIAIRPVGRSELSGSFVLLPAL
jgi:hypothetical protein